MRLPRKPLSYALVVSLLVHLVLLFSPHWELPEFKPAPTLSVSLSQAAPVETLRLQARPRRAARLPTKLQPETQVSAPASPPTLASEMPLAASAVSASTPVPTSVQPTPPIASSDQTPTTPANTPTTNAAKPAPTVQREFPSQIQLVFNVYRGSEGLLLGKTTHQWQVHDNDYVISSTTEATGLFSLFFRGKYFMSSRGKLTDTGLQPEAFAVQRGQVERSEQASFDWDHQTLRYGKLDDLHSAALAAGTQDQLSGMYQLALTAPHHGRVQVPVTTGRKLNQYEYQVVGDETVDTPLGKFKSEHISSVKQAQDDDTGDIWLAKEQHYLPVRFKITTHDGEILDHLLAEVHITAP